MKFTPNSTARLRTRLASPGSLGSPQIPLPVSRIAPYPRRFTSRSPPIVNVFFSELMVFGCSRDGDRRYFDANLQILVRRGRKLGTENRKLETGLLSLQHLHHPIEILEGGVFDHYLPLALPVADTHSHTQHPFHLSLGRAHIGIDPARSLRGLVFYQ